MSWLGDFGSVVLGTLYAERVAVAIIAGGSFLALALVAWRRRWLGAARRHPGRSAVVLLPVVALALPVGWYLGSPLVLSSTIDEPAPAAVASPTATGTAPPEASVRPTSPSLAPPSSGAGTPSRAPIPLAYRGTFHGSDEFHFGRGTARLIETEPGRLVVRLEDFAVRNGPDLYVYLSPDATGYAAGAIELGRLKADRGNQNYAVPDGALREPTQAASVVIWCRQFSHLFATAPLAPV